MKAAAVTFKFHPLISFLINSFPRFFKFTRYGVDHQMFQRDSMRTSILPVKTIGLNSSLLICITFFLVCFCMRTTMGQAGVIYQTDFQETTPLNTWTYVSNDSSASATVDTGYQSTQAALIQRPVGGTGTAAYIQRQLPVESLRGYRVRFAVMVKSESVTQPQSTLNGIKFMVPITTPTGTVYRQVRITTVYGSDFDWRLIVFCVDVPADATSINLILGLEGSTGKVWFDNMLITPTPPLMYQADFQETSPLSNWTYVTNDSSASATVDTGYQSTQSILVERPVGGTGTAAYIQRQLPIDNIRGKRLYFSAMIKSDSVSQPPNPCTGIKFMVPIVTPNGNQYPQVNITQVYGGSFDWTQIGFYVNVPPNATSASLILGLEATTGKAWFDDVQITLDKHYRTDFQETSTLSTWSVVSNGSGTATIDTGYQSTQAVLIERPLGDSGTSVNIQKNLSIDNIRGCILQVTAWVKAENVSQPPYSWNGIKLMLPITTLNGTNWLQASIGYGTFDWKKITFPVRVPDNATNIQLVLGLEAVTGKVWFDDVSITVRRTPIVPIPLNSTMYKGHDLPRLRGTMINPALVQEDLRVLGEDWNANVIRWQITNWNPVGSEFDPDAYDYWLETKLQQLDAALPWCEQYGLKVVVDMHGAPRSAAGGTIFTDTACREKFIEVWQEMADRYKNSDVVWGYDLANEPTEGNVAENCQFWDELAQETAEAILAIDTSHAIIVEAPQVYGFSEFFQPLTASHIVYSMHMYSPLVFTHQTVIAGYDTPYEYPGTISGTYWDINQIRKDMKPVIEFQKKYNVHMYIGEFSAVRWAPNNSAYNYLCDVIDVFEENGWDWTYHAFRESNVWSVELSEDRYDLTPPATPTDRQVLLTDWFGENEKP